MGRLQVRYDSHPEATTEENIATGESLDGAGPSPTGNPDGSDR